MANELTIDVGVSFAKSGAESITIRKPAQSVTVSGSRGITLTQNVGTSEETIDIQSLPSVNWVYFENLGPTNYVELYVTSAGTPFARLPAGVGFALPLRQSTFYAKANTAAINLRIVPFEQ